MINVKPQIYEALKKVCDNVNDGYPSDWANFPVVSYIEENNSTRYWTDGREQYANIRFKIDIWCKNQSTSNLAILVDDEMNKLGLKRTQALDVPDPSGLKHKVLRYDGLINVSNEIVYDN